MADARLRMEAAFMAQLAQGADATIMGEAGNWSLSASSRAVSGLVMQEVRPLDGGGRLARFGVGIEEPTAWDQILSLQVAVPLVDEGGRKQSFRVRFQQAVMLRLKEAMQGRNLRSCRLRVVAMDLDEAGKAIRADVSVAAP